MMIHFRSVNSFFVNIITSIYSIYQSITPSDGTKTKDKRKDKRMWKLHQTLVVIALCCIAVLAPCTAFVTQSKRQILLSELPQQRLLSTISSFSAVILKAAEDDEKVEVGSKEYLEGFLSSPIQDESVAERGSGLEQALKLGGFFAIGLAVLFLGFMASNGLL